MKYYNLYIKVNKMSATLLYRKSVKSNKLSTKLRNEIITNNIDLTLYMNAMDQISDLNKRYKENFEIVKGGLLKIQKEIGRIRGSKLDYPQRYNDIWDVFRGLSEDEMAVLSQLLDG